MKSNAGSYFAAVTKSGSQTPDSSRDNPKTIGSPIILRPIVDAAFYISYDSGLHFPTMLNSHPLCPHLQFKDEFFIFLKQ